MAGVTTNAGELAARYDKRLSRLDAALKRGITRVAVAVDNAQVENLRGGTNAGDYPIPVRTGTLLGAHFFRVTGIRQAVVGNTASYAGAVHRGVHKTIQVSGHEREAKTVFGLRKTVSQQVPQHSRTLAIKGRPFLDDAVHSVDAAELMAIDIEREVLA